MDALLPWSHAEGRLERAANSWLATIRPDRRPHVTPVWGVWVDGTLYFDGHPGTRWARNLAANPAAAVHLESGDDAVIVEGVVDDLDRVTDPDLAARILDAWRTKYGRLLPGSASMGPFRLRPLAVRGWSNATQEDGTRWRFAAGRR